MIRSSRGITVIELVVFVGILGAVGYWVANFIRVPAKMNQTYQQAQLERDLSRYMDAITSDLREASPASLANAITTLPANVIQIQKIKFNISNPSNPSITQILYSTGSVPVSLIRTLTPPGGPTTSQTLFTAPDPAIAITMQFSSASAGQIDVTIHYTKPGVPNPVTTTVTRRVSIRS